MAQSTAEQLARVQSQIAAIETAGVESYSIANRSATKLKLAGLYAREEQLLNRLNRESGSGAFSLGTIGGRRR